MRSVILFIVLLISSFFEEHESYIICRSCGNNILKSSDLIEKKSLSAVYSFNDTLFDRDSVLVQILNRDIIFQFPIITTNSSNCVEFGEWEEEELWFPGYYWRPCLCPDCGVLIGWIFTKYTTKTNQPSDTFFALILPNLLSEKFLESLIRYPV